MPINLLLFNENATCEEFKKPNDYWVDIEEAKQIFADRMEKDDSPVKGFLFSVDKLKAMLDKIQENNDDIAKKKIDFIRVWKGGNRKYDMLLDCDCNSSTPPKELSDFHEDLILMPVFYDGEDVYLNNDEPKLNEKQLILAGSRPCPEWCATRSTEGEINMIDQTGKYFYSRNGKTRVNTNAQSNPYSHYCP